MVDLVEDNGEEEVVVEREEDVIGGRVGEEGRDP